MAGSALQYNLRDLHGRNVKSDSFSSRSRRVFEGLTEAETMNISSVNSSLIAQSVSSHSTCTTGKNLRTVVSELELSTALSMQK